MADGKKISVALVRGDSLSDWEGKLWENLDGTIAVTGFSSRRNLYRQQLRFPTNRLPTTSDNFFINNFQKYLHGTFQKMRGLEKGLQNFDIAHTAEIYYAYTHQAVKAKESNKKLKVVCTVWDNSFGRFEYNYWPGLSTPPRFWREKISKIINDNIIGVDLFLPVSTGAAALLEDYGVPKKKIQLLVPGIFNHSPSVASEVRKKYNVGEKDVYLTVCRLVKQKGIYDVLYAWKMFTHSTASTKVLLVIGSGPEQRNIKRLISEWGMEDSVRVLSLLPNTEVRSLYAVAKSLILASVPTPQWQEQFGFVLAEAMSAGCPVIAANSGAIPEVVASGGILFRPGDPVDLKNSMQVLIDQYSVVAEHARQNSKRFTAERFCKELTNIYLSIAQV